MRDRKRCFYKSMIFSIVFIGIILIISFGVSMERYDGYRPMVYLNNQLYSDSGKQCMSLPEEWICTGEINKRVSAEGPMVEKNFTSNCIDEGASVFENEKVKECIYVNDGESYIMFELLNEH